MISTICGNFRSCVLKLIALECAVFIVPTREYIHILIRKSCLKSNALAVGYDCLRCCTCSWWTRLNGACRCVNRTVIISLCSYSAWSNIDKICIKCEVSLYCLGINYIAGICTIIKNRGIGFFGASQIRVPTFKFILRRNSFFGSCLKCYGWTPLNCGFNFCNCRT